MIDILGVVENPKMAEIIASLLSKGRFIKESEVSITNPFYSFSFIIQGKNRNIKLVSTNGQIFTGNLERSLNDLVSSLKNIFQYTIPIKETILISNIKKIAFHAKQIIVFADCSLNGDLFAYQISTLCEKPVMRPLFSSLSYLNLEESIVNMKELNYTYALSHSFDFESKYRFSNIISNFLNTYLVKNIKAKANSVILNPLNLSILSTIYNLNFEQEAHSNEAYTVEVKFLKDGTTYSPKWQRGDLYCKLTAFSLYSNILNGSSQVKVINKELNVVEKIKPLPLNYGKLLRLANKYLKLSYSDIEKLSNELYIEGYISYPFTNSTRYSDEFDFLGTVFNLSSFEPVSDFISSLKKRIEQPRINKDQEIENVNHNLPIYPSNIFMEDVETPKGQLFLLIVRHFLASLSENLYLNEYLINFQVSDEIFQLNFQQIDKKNAEYCWLTIFPYKSFDDYEDEIPDFNEDEVITPKSIKFTQVKNSPLEINESTLFKIFRSKGISEREIIDGLSNLTASNLIKKNVKGFKTTDFASALVISFEEIGFDFRDDYFLSSFAETAKQIREENNNNARINLLQKFYAMIQEIKSKSKTFESLMDLILNQNDD